MQDRTIRHAQMARGISIAYAVTGAGPPLVLIHGAEADHTMFDQFVPFMASDFACIGYDQRDSGATINPPEPYDVTDLADDAAGLIAALGHRKVHVFGTSFGSIIAQALAVRHPALVDRLVLSAAIRIGRSIADQLAGNSGSVLDVAAMSSTGIPGTTRPRISPAVAIR